MKRADQQARLVVHRLRQRYKEERTACVNRIRGLLTEFGLVFAQGPDAVRLALPEVMEDVADAETICEAVARPNMRFVPVKSI